MAPPNPSKSSSKFSPARLSAAQRYLTAFVARHRPEGSKPNDQGFTVAAQILDVSQPTITNALGPVGSFGPKLLEALARVDRVSFDLILDWDPEAEESATPFGAGDPRLRAIPESPAAALRAESKPKKKRDSGA